MFRATDGKIGVMDEHCPHRRASLFFGRNEECGIRCVYHGWKFDIEGNCMEMPSEPPESDYRRKVKARAYAAREAGGLLWVFMGDQANVAAMPDFEWLDLPEGHLFASRWEQECNSIQAMEGELDASHVSFLHRRLDQLDDQLRRRCPEAISRKTVHRAGTSRTPTTVSSPHRSAMSTTTNPTGG